MSLDDTRDLASQERGLFDLKPLRGIKSTSFQQSLESHKGNDQKDSSPHCNDNSQYRGRFAPSPSGPLHFGSLIAAVASYCQAKSNNGVWLVRMEDIDPPREQIGADKLIVDCLHAHGLYSDEPIVYQSQRTDVYAQAITYLASQDKVFYCSCTRKELRERLDHDATTTVYPGTCRNKKNEPKNCSTRLFVTTETCTFNDLVYGPQSQDLCHEVGDFVLQRRDGLFSYQLAVVIDDIAQGITEVVRGVDLLDSTPRQLYLYQQLGYKAPSFAHLPLVLQSDGKKLSKQTGAEALNNSKASQNLVLALDFLKQNPDPELIKSESQAILQWAVTHWTLSNIESK